MKAKNSLRAALLCLAFSSVILFTALACALPINISIVDSTPTPEPTVPAAPAITSTAAPQPVPPTMRPDASPAPATQPTEAPQVSEVKIFLVAVGDGGASGKAVGCGDSLVAVSRQVNPTRQPIAAALNELFSIKSQFLGQSGLYNALYQSNLRVESAAVDANNIGTVVLSGQVLMGGECDTPRFKAQIEQTIISAGGLQSVNILLNGKTIDEALSLK